MKTISAAEFDKKFDDGEDISEYVDWSKARLVNWEREIVQLEIPKQDLTQLDAEVARLGTTRDRLISKWVRERLANVTAAE
ncbi:CopG family transcriptional regulator [Rhizobium sp. CG5]|uniref:type II toxin-antitoxin system BrnA family antitoxin n=1 Tax=Rhizobium sp. CG5 TaxID=2726076 RepID=UPI0020346B63|nr:CopG family transcriptional regulator [Rhizobium sp. CG5]MCM2477706.1 CopG family transcriptional regulator [Rhizobium sp. CG5]